MSMNSRLGKSRNNSQRLASLTTVHRERRRRRREGARGARATRPLRDGSDPDRSKASKLEHFDSAWQVASLAGENLAMNVSRRAHSVTIEDMPASPSCKQPERSSVDNSAPPKFVTTCLIDVKPYLEHMGNSRACNGDAKQVAVSSRARRSLTMLVWAADMWRRRRKRHEDDTESRESAPA